MFKEPVPFQQVFDEALQNMNQGRELAVRVLETNGMTWHNYAKDPRTNKYRLLRVSNDPDKPLDVRNNKWTYVTEFDSPEDMRKSMIATMKNANDNLHYFNSTQIPPLKRTELSVHNIFYPTEKIVKVADVRQEATRSGMPRRCWLYLALLIALIALLYVLIK